MGANTFVLHDSSVNTYGFRMLTEGADLTVFKSNPVMLLNHDDWDLPIGRWDNVRTEGDQILADAVFDETDERAMRVAGKVSRGFLKSASVGAKPVATSDDASTWHPGQKYPTVTQWVLREASICSIGANHNALVLYDHDNRIMDFSKPYALMSLCDNAGNAHFMLNQNNYKMNLRKLFKLNDAASDESVSEVAEGILEENRKLKAEKAALEAENVRLKDSVALAASERAGNEEREATALVDQAIRDARLSADGRQAWLDDFKTDFARAKVRLSSIPARQGIAQQVQSGADSEFVKLSWDELDRKGKLVELKASDPALYVQKYRERFGVEPNL